MAGNHGGNHATGPQADLAELRTIVMRAREQAQEITRAAQAARAQLQPQRDQLRQEREQSQREVRDAMRNGQLGPEQRAVVERIERGETTWRAVASGEDDHWSAVGFRESLGERLEALVEDLREHDPEFRDEHEAALRNAADVRRRLL